MASDIGDKKIGYKRINSFNVVLSVLLIFLISVISVIVLFCVIPPTLAAEVTMEVYQQADGKAFGQSTSLDIFNNEDLGGQKIIHPFTRGTYTFAVYNNAASGLLPYTLLIESVNSDNVPMVYSLQKNGVYVLGGSTDAEMLPISTYQLSQELLSGNRTDLYTLDWRWDTDTDPTDTTFGLRAGAGDDSYYTLKITAIGTIDEDSLPQTGDSMNMIYWVILLGAAMLVMIILFICHRAKQNKERNENETSNQDL